MIKHLAFIIMIGICCVNTLYSQSQNIGFGTSNPQARLDIAGGSGATNLLRVSNDGSAPYDSSILVDPTGKLGIGTTSPTEKLHIEGNLRLTQGLYDSTNTAGTDGQILQTTGGAIKWVDASFNDSFDGDRTVTRSGLPAVNPGTTTTLADFIEAYFFPDVGPTRSLSIAIDNADPNYNASTREYGNTDRASTINWSVTKHTNGISSITVDGSSKTVSNSIDEDSDTDGNNQNSTQAKTLGADGVSPQNCSMTVNDSKSNVFNNNSNTISWKHRYYRGTSSLTPSAMKTNLASTTPYSNYGFTTTGAAASRTNGSGTYNCTGGKYLYYLYPKSGGTGIVGGGFGQIPSGTSGYVTSGGLPWTAFTSETITIKDRFNISREYVLIYSNDIKYSSFSITIVN